MRQPVTHRHAMPLHDERKSGRADRYSGPPALFLPDLFPQEETKAMNE
jgi:hypothetical protein